MNKDRELREVIHELTTQIIGELVGYFKDEEGFVIKLEDQAISQIKALVIESLKIIYKRRYPEFDSANLKNGQIAVMSYVKEMMDKWQL